MADVNTNARVAADANLREAGGRVDKVADERGVRIRDARPNVMPSGEGTQVREGYQEPFGGGDWYSAQAHEGPSYGSQEDTSLDQTVSRDMGSLGSTEPLRAQSEHDNARASGMRPQVPLSDVLGENPRAESMSQPRYDKAEIHGNLAESSVDAVLNGMNRAERGPVDFSITKQDVDRMDAAILSRRRQSQQSGQPRHMRREESSQQVQRQDSGADVTNEVAEENDVAEQVSDGRKPDSFFNRPWGWDPVDRNPRTTRAPNRRNTTAMKTAKNAAAREFKRAGRGRRIYGKMNGYRRLSLMQVGIGLGELKAVIDQDSTMLSKLIREQVKNFDLNVDEMSLGQLAEFINNNQIWVATFKPPNNRGQDMQHRRLIVLNDTMRGIYLHPIMAAMYTADFDGDDMQISLDPSVIMLTKNPMDYMVGIDRKHSLNDDFLPVHKILPVNDMTEREYVRTTFFDRLYKRIGNDVDGRILSPLVDVVIKLGDNKAGWADVFLEARRVSDRLSNYNESLSQSYMSDLCQGIYEGMHSTFYDNTLAKLGTERTSTPVPRTYDDQVIYKVVEGMVDGKAPSNFQELKIALSGYLGNVKDKNAPFRFSADVGKMIKMDNRYLIGGEYVFEQGDNQAMKSLFESTMKFMGSEKMQKEIKKAGRSEYYTQTMRERVIAEVGFPESYASYGAFLNRFVSVYQRQSALINEANLVFLADMGISGDSNRGVVSALKISKGGVTLGDIAEPLRSIYGNYSVGRMFNGLVTGGQMMRGRTDPYWSGNPNHADVPEKRLHRDEREHDRGSDGMWITGKYMHFSLNRFVHENRFSKKGVSTINARRLASLEKMSDVDVQYEMLVALADKRTSAASKFNEKTYGIMADSKNRTTHTADEDTVVRRMSDLLNELKKISESNSRDQMLWADDLAQLLYESGPDLFSYFGMDNTAGFLSSEWTQQMLANKDDLEVLGGIRTAMIFVYRMSNIDRLIAQLDEAPDPNEDSEHYMDMHNNAQFAINELADSSEVWHGIIQEMRAEDSENSKSVFQMMREGEGELSERLFKTNPNGEKYKWLDIYDGGKFWANMDDSHMTLRDVIEDLSMPRDLKWSIIADVVRYWENDAGLQSWEVGFQLEIGNDSAYSLDASGKQSALKVSRDFEKAFNRWGKQGRDALVKEIHDAAANHRNKPGHLTRTLKRLVDCPWELVSISDDAFSDAIMSVKDKSYAQTEKGSQHPWTNFIYEALSTQHNGGFMNDIARTDDRLLGVISAESVSIHDVVFLLANPDEMLWVYNQYGEVGMITCDLLLSSVLGRDFSNGVTEADIWEFLEAEPRIAAAIRCHSMSSIADTDGTAYLGSRLSINETMNHCVQSEPNPIDHIKYLMRNHPGYAAIISLASKSPTIDGKRVGSVTRNERRRVHEIEEYLCAQLYRGSRSSLDEGEVAKRILESMGITDVALKQTMESGYDRFLESLGLVAKEDDSAESDAMIMYEQVLGDLTRYIKDDIRPNVDLSGDVDRVPKPDNMGVDIVSMASYWDVVQELSGAKTAVSTGIEGSETYKFAEWASHISSVDRFADLQAVTDDVDQSWNGMTAMWIDDSGNCQSMVLEINGDETSNIDEIENAASGKEIVVTTPEGYVVKDRSTDTHGIQVPSLPMFMVSKRSNGAEAFNLKAKKAGIDGKDSIIKMEGRYRMERDLETGEMRRTDFFFMRDDLQREATRYNDEQLGLQMARMMLAQRLMEENESLSYDDMTLANYMCLAEMMLIRDESGTVQLRSLEMLFSAMKHRIGPKIDDMSEEEIRSAERSILEDTSDTGVGIALMSSSEAFDMLRPRSKSTTSAGIRLASSVFSRNYDLMSELASENPDVIPLTQFEAESLDGRWRKLEGIKEVTKRINVARGYNIVGYSGAMDENAEQENIRWTIGPSNAIVIGEGYVTRSDVERICDMANQHGMTVIVASRHLSKIPAAYRADAMPCSENGDALIPMFDMRLNGSEASPYNGGRFAIKQTDYSRYVVSVEDSTNEFGLGDAQVIATRDLVDRVQIVHSDSARISMGDLFPNVLMNKKYNHHSFTITLASGAEIKSLVANGLRCTVDYGIAEGGRGFDQRKKDVDKVIERYQERFSEANADGILMGVECEPGDIIGFAEIEIMDNNTGEVSYVLAPLIPFPLHGPTKNIPERYTIENMGPVDSDGTVFHFDWRNTSKITDGFVKYFDSSGGANKGMLSFIDTIGRRLLRDGTKIDAYIAKASTDSRKIGTDRRIKTMISLMALARMHGYNFARDYAGEAFPVDENHPENEGLADAMIAGSIPMSSWREWLANDRMMLFTYDRKLNAFLNHECRKILEDGGNPSDYLANVYTDENGIESNTHVMWEFEAMFDQGINYEDGLLHFLHSMDGSFCPDGIDDTKSDYTFRLYRDENGQHDGYDNGVLQMQVPHVDGKGRTIDVWDNVYIGMSFFGEDYSGFSRPNVDGASNMLDGMNTMSYYGMKLDDKSARTRASWATSDIGRVRDGGAFGKVPRGLGYGSGMTMTQTQEFDEAEEPQEQVPQEQPTQEQPTTMANPPVVDASQVESVIDHQQLGTDDLSLPLDETNGVMETEPTTIIDYNGQWRQPTYSDDDWVEMTPYENSETKPVAQSVDNRDYDELDEESYKLAKEFDKGQSSNDTPDWESYELVTEGLYNDLDNQISRHKKAPEKDRLNILKQCYSKILDMADKFNVPRDLDTLNFNWMESLDEAGLIPLDWWERPEWLSTSYYLNTGRASKEDMRVPDDLLPPWGRIGYWLGTEDMFDFKHMSKPQRKDFALDEDYEEVYGIYEALRSF